MSNPEKTKEKTYTETEFNKRLTEELNRKPRVSYSIAHGYSQAGRCPELNIKIEGGDAVATHALLVQIESLLLEYSKNNPPKPEDFAVPTKPHFLPAATQIGEPA